MKLEQIIDEMQALLTKLRGKMRSRVIHITTEELEEIQSGKRPWPKGTAGECILCGFKHPKLHPAFASGLPEGVIDKLMQPTPDPLHVRVAKEIGKKVRYHNGEWQEYFDDIDAWLPVLRRDKKVELAMGALEEYCRNWVYDVQIYRQIDMRIWRVAIGNTIKGEDCLPQAICEAIVAHAEGE